MARANVTFVSGLGFDRVSLHAVQVKEERISFHSAGVHLLEGRLVFPRHMAGSHLTATRIVKPPSIPIVAPMPPPLSHCSSCNHP